MAWPLLWFAYPDRLPTAAGHPLSPPFHPPPHPMRLNPKMLLTTAASLAVPALALAQDAATTAAPAAAEATAAVPAAPPAVDSGTTAWMLTSTCLVLLMVPGLALFYAGLVRTKNVLGTMMHSFVAMALIGVAWVVVGYAMCFGATQFGGIIGWDPAYLCLKGIEAKDGATFTVAGNTIPHFVFIMFQGKFAIITPALIAGAFAERVKFSSYCIFILLWSLLIYCPLCHMIWGPGLMSCQNIDLAGGTVIHIAAGVAGLVAALYLGARRGYPKVAMHPNNLTMTLLGAGLLWVGWFGFNSGSTVQSGLDTGRSLAMTQIAAAAGAVTWMLIEAVKHKKATSLGFVSGMLAGLVAITPAAADVTPIGAIMLGVIPSIICFFAVQMKNKLGYDDSLDVFGIHGVAGIVGALALLLFLRDGALPAAGTEGATRASTVMGQLILQLKGIGLSVVLSGVVTLILLVVIDKTIGFRLSEADEQAGMDHALHGENGYGLQNLN